MNRLHRCESQRWVLFMLPLMLFAGLAATRLTAAPIVTGTGAGTLAHVKSFDEAGTETASFLPYAGFTGGVRVAVGDVDGDGIADIITGTGGNSAAHVKVFRGADQALLSSFFAYPPSFTGGVYVAAGDVNGDGTADIITGAGTNGATHVKVFDGAGGAELRSFFAYPGVNSEVRVASGDVNGDGRADIITSLGPGFAPHVKVFDGASSNLLASFFAYSTAFTGGVYVAAGDVNGDGLADIITGAGINGFTHVKVFRGDSVVEMHSFLAYQGVNAEVRVAGGDMNGDGIDDIITGLGEGASPHIKAFDGRNLELLRSFFAYPASFTGGVYVASQPVPEPSSLLLAALGLAACTGAARRTRWFGRFRSVSMA
jgi:hypothetical protein